MFKHLFCLPQSPVLCQEGKQTRCVPDEYSNVLFLGSVIPMQISARSHRSLGRNCLYCQFRKQLKCIFLYSPQEPPRFHRGCWASVRAEQAAWSCGLLLVIEPLSETAAALSGETVEQRGAGYSNSFQFQISTVSFVNNSLKCAGCHFHKSEAHTEPEKNVRCWHVLLISHIVLRIVYLFFFFF